MYSNDLKHKVIQLREDGLSYREISQILHLSVSVVHYMCNKGNNIASKLLWNGALSQTCAVSSGCQYFKTLFSKSVT